MVSEIIAVDPEAVAQATTVIGFDNRNDSGFKNTNDSIEAAGGIMIAQLWHPGRQQLWHPTKAPTGVSDGPDPYSWTVAHVMQGVDILNLTQLYNNQFSKILAGNKLFDHYDDGLYRGPIEEIHYKNEN